VLGLDPQVSAYLVELDVAVRVLELETADRSRLHGPVLGVERRPRADVAHVHVAVAGGQGEAALHVGHRDVAVPALHRDRALDAEDPHVVEARGHVRGRRVLHVDRAVLVRHHHGGAGRHDERQVRLEAHAIVPAHLVAVRGDPHDAARGFRARGDLSREVPGQLLRGPVDDLAQRELHFPGLARDHLDAAERVRHLHARSRRGLGAGRLLEGVGRSVEPSAEDAAALGADVHVAPHGPSRLQRRSPAEDQDEEADPARGHRTDLAAERAV
jgi:hypothetical protein